MAKKGEKITDETTLERLRLAREKASAMRKQRAEEKRSIQLLAKDLEYRQELAQAEEKITNAATSDPSPTKQVSQNRKNPLPNQKRNLANLK